MYTLLKKELGVVESVMNLKKVSLNFSPYDDVEVGQCTFSRQDLEKEDDHLKSLLIAYMTYNDIKHLSVSLID